MKLLHKPTSCFNQEPPKYQEIAIIIKKMKASSSPCPFDQTSVLVLKKCLICVEIIRTLLGKSLILRLWKKGLTVLAYKKGLADDPANLQPITLEPVIAKVLTSLIRNRIYAFLCKNQYIETNIQKGFWTGISCTIEHTELMSHLINHARQKQRSFVVTLIDLKNAFGESTMSSYMQYSVFTIYQDPLKSSYYIFTMVFIFQLQQMVFLWILSQYKEEFYKETAFHH